MDRCSAFLGGGILFLDLGSHLMKNWCSVMNYRFEPLADPHIAFFTPIADPLFLRFSTEFSIEFT
jgi:hypothetical protein